MKSLNLKNSKVLKFLEKERANFPLITKVEDIEVDLYYELGSHPDIVKHLWDEINSNLPFDCRYLIYGTPSLINYESSKILSLAIGTEYVIRLSKNLISKRSDENTVIKWSDGTITDLEKELGSEWIAGSWDDLEIKWLLEHFE